MAAQIISDQVLMGCGVAIVSMIGLRHEEWLLAESDRLQWLRRRVGDSPAAWILRAALLFGVTFGTLLAAGVIRPLYASAAPGGPQTPVVRTA